MHPTNPLAVAALLAACSAPRVAAQEEPTLASTRDWVAGGYDDGVGPRGVWLLPMDRTEDGGTPVISEPVQILGGIEFDETQPNPFDAIPLRGTSLYLLQFALDQLRQERGVDFQARIEDSHPEVFERFTGSFGSITWGELIRGQVEFRRPYECVARVGEETRPLEMVIERNLHLAKDFPGSGRPSHHGTAALAQWVLTAVSGEDWRAVVDRSVRQRLGITSLSFDASSRIDPAWSNDNPPLLAECAGARDASLAPADVFRFLAAWAENPYARRWIRSVGGVSYRRTRWTPRIDLAEIPSLGLVVAGIHADGSGFTSCIESVVADFSGHERPRRVEGQWTSRNRPDRWRFEGPTPTSPRLRIGRYRVRFGTRSGVGEVIVTWPQSSEQSTSALFNNEPIGTDGIWESLPPLGSSRLKLRPGQRRSDGLRLTLDSRRSDVVAFAEYDRSRPRVHLSWRADVERLEDAHDPEPIFEALDRQLLEAAELALTSSSKNSPTAPTVLALRLGERREVLHTGLANRAQHVPLGSLSWLGFAIAEGWIERREADEFEVEREQRSLAEAVGVSGDDPFNRPWLPLISRIERGTPRRPPELLLRASLLESIDSGTEGLWNSSPDTMDWFAVMQDACWRRIGVYESPEEFVQETLRERLGLDIAAGPNAGALRTRVLLDGTLAQAPDTEAVWARGLWASADGVMALADQAYEGPTSGAIDRLSEWPFESIRPATGLSGLRLEADAPGFTRRLLILPSFELTIFLFRAAEDPAWADEIERQMLQVLNPNITRFPVAPRMEPRGREPHLPPLEEPRRVRPTGQYEGSVQLRERQRAFEFELPERGHEAPGSLDGEPAVFILQSATRRNAVMTLELGGGDTLRVTFRRPFLGKEMDVMGELLNRHGGREPVRVTLTRT